MTSITKELAPTLVSINATHAEDPFSGKWLVYLQPEETRTSDVNGHLSGATLRVYCWIISRPNQVHRPTRACYFDASFNAWDNLAAVVDSVLFLDPDDLRGLGLGSVMMNQIIEWVREWPDAQIKHIDIGKKKDVAERRQRFYGRFGLKFSQNCSTEASPRLLPMMVKELITAPVPETILTHDLIPLIYALRARTSTNERTLRSQKSEIQELYAHRNAFIARPIWTGLKHWIKFYPFQLLFIVFVMAMAMALLF